MEVQDTDQDPTPPESLPPPSSSSPSPDAAAAAMTTIGDVSSSQAQEMEEEESERPENQDDNPRQQQQQQQQQSSIPSSRANTVGSEDAILARARCNACATFQCLLTFWLFVSALTLINIYGPSHVQLGPNCSRLIQINPLFVQAIQVQEKQETRPGPVLYGFHKSPPLDQEITWTEAHNTFVPINQHEEWLYFLNEGSRIDVLFHVKSTSYQTVMLVIVQGKDNLVDWTKNPLHLNATLSWYLIHGIGRIKQEITASSDYYIAVGNIYSKEVEIEMKFTIKSVVYNTTEAYYKCSLGDRLCSFKLSLHGTEAAVLTSPAHNEAPLGDDWYVVLYYIPRWLIFAIVSGLVTTFMVVAILCCYKSQITQDLQLREMRPERAPLLSPNDDDISSHGSYHLSLHSDEEDLEGSFGGLASTKDCAVCLNSPIDSVFFPCGHQATCIPCAKRLEDEAGDCPNCGRKINKVKKIYSS